MTYTTSKSKYISFIDDCIHTQAEVKPHGWCIAKPIEAFGLLKWRIRFIKARAILKGEADAIKYKY